MAKWYKKLKPIEFKGTKYLYLVIRISDWPQDRFVTHFYLDPLPIYTRKKYLFFGPIVKYHSWSKYEFEVNIDIENPYYSAFDVECEIEKVTRNLSTLKSRQEAIKNGNII